MRCRQGTGPSCGGAKPNSLARSLLMGRSDQSTPLGMLRASPSQPSKRRCIAEAMPFGCNRPMDALSEILKVVQLNGAIFFNCLLYTSDAADERSSVDLGG